MSDLHLHKHSEHSHYHSGGQDAQRKVGIAALITFTFMFAEVVGGLISGSLALLADAAHMLTDAGSLMLAYVGYALARRPADVNRTFGFSRFKVLASFVNGLLLLLLGIWIIVEAVHRILEPEPVLSGIMFWVAVIGLLLNLAMLKLLHGGHDHSHDLNMQGALMHVIGDLLGSVAAVAAAIIIYTTGWTLADPLLSILVALILLAGALPIIRKSAHILLQGTPAGVDLQAISAGVVEALSGVSAVHHIHAWSLTGQDRLITLHVVPKDRSTAMDLIPAVREVLKDRFGIDHATIELDLEPLDECDIHTLSAADHGCDHHGHSHEKHDHGHNTHS